MEGINCITVEVEAGIISTLTWTSFIKWNFAPTKVYDTCVGEKREQNCKLAKVVASFWEINGVSYKTGCESFNALPKLKTSQIAIANGDEH